MSDSPGIVTAYERPYLYPKQERAIFSGKRWSLCEASTKSGKTVGAIVRIIEAALAGTFGQNFWWVAPVSDQALIAFNRVKNNLTPGTFTAKSSPPYMVTLLSGAIIHFKSADNPDSLYGEDVYGCVFDEASRARPEAWTAVRSTLTATRGWAVLIGNVKGRRNWFFEFARRVEAGKEPNGHFERITWRDAVAAGVLDLEEIDDARRNLPEKDFRELYEAEAADDGGNPFGLLHISECVVGGLSPNPPVAFGIDLAKKQDYLVIIGLDNSGGVCHFSRWNGVPWRDSIRRIHEIVGEDVPALVDSTGLGDPVLEELQYGHGNFFGYNFSAASKQRIMEGLAVSIQGHEIHFPAGPIPEELGRFEYVITRTGVQYSAPEGYNDDCVCALALARQQWTETQPGVNIMNFYADAAQREAQAALAEPGAKNRPWRLEDDSPSFNELVENELTSLYEETIRNIRPTVERKCRRCGEELPAGVTRVTDGEFIWHATCAG